MFLCVWHSIVCYRLFLDTMLLFLLFSLRSSFLSRPPSVFLSGELPDFYGFSSASVEYRPISTSKSSERIPKLCSLRVPSYAILALLTYVISFLSVFHVRDHSILVILTIWKKIVHVTRLFVRTMVVTNGYIRKRSL